MTTSPVVTITDELVAELEKERQRRFDGNELNSKELTQLHAANQRLETENAQLKSALVSNTARRYVGDDDQRTIDELVAAGIRVDQQEIKRLEAEVARLKGDAERYRWLRNPDQDVSLVLDKQTGYTVADDSVPGVGAYFNYEYRAGEELDAAIDAKLASRVPKESA